MNKRNNNNKKIFKTFKDYLVPIILVFIIFIFVVNYFFSSNENTKINVNDKSYLSVLMNSSQTEAYITYPGGNEVKVEGQVSLYKGEKIETRNESVKLTNDLLSFNLNKLGIFKYNEDESYTLVSSDLWCEAKKDINITMNFAKVKGSNGSIFSLYQNEIASTIYVVHGTVEVQNLAGKSTILQKGDKIVIMRGNDIDTNLNLSLSKEPIGDSTKNEDWFLKNNGPTFLSQNENTNSGSLFSTGIYNSGILLDNTNSESVVNGKYISFTNIYDEFESLKDTIDIDGSIIDGSVNNININGKTAEINAQNKTFSLKGLKIAFRENDIVYKIYDSQSKLLHKGVITVYYSKGNISSGEKNNSLAQVENYPLTTSPLYQIVSPKSNPYTTEEDLVRIEGTIPARTVKKIIVNDFELKKFPQYGSYWQYFANSDFGNLKPGVNIYKIQFFGDENKLVYETNFTVIKEEKKVEPPKENIEKPKEENGTEVKTETETGTVDTNSGATE